MVSDRLMRLCQETETVTSALSKKPEAAPGDVVKQLYGSVPKDGDGDNAPAGDGLDRALRCGRWGPTSPSRLFLQAFANALGCLASDPVAGMVSPPLMGSHGTVPLTVISTLADVVRHCASLIARAETDVVFVTCAWSPSLAQRLIRAALVELSRRAGERGRRVVVKIVYDKAGVRNAVDAHQLVKPATYTAKAVQLPSPEEIPHVQLEVMNYHRFVLGTLHAKFCIVDGKQAVVMSNNIEDNCNMEMMAHLKGPVVAGIYDAALITWDKALRPPLPSHGVVVSGGGEKPGPPPEPAPEPRFGSLDPVQDQVPFGAKNGHGPAVLPEHSPEDPHYDGDIAGEIARMQSCYAIKPHETRLQAANRQLNLVAPNPAETSGPEIPEGEELTPYIATGTDGPVPIALVSRQPYGPLDCKSLRVPQNEAWLSLIRNCRRSIFIQTPDLNAKPLLPALAAALARGVEVTYYVCFGYNDAGEQMPGQGGNNEQAARTLMRSLPPDGPERQWLHIYHYVAKDQDRPIHQARRSRACHIKLLIADEAVAVHGSGNMDTQSWFHSQEINVMVDSPDVCRRWRTAIDRNQNTAAFGRVTGDDGVWRDAEGKPADGYLGDPNLLKVLLGMARMKSMGGF